MRGRGEESEREASVHEQNRAFDANLLPGRPRRPSTYQYAQNDVALIDPHLHVSVPTPRIPRPPPPSPHIPRARRVGHAPPLDGPARGFDAGRASVSAALAARGRRVEPPAGSSQSRSRATAGRCRERPRSRLRVLSRGPLPAAPDAVRRVRRNPDRRLPRRAERARGAPRGVPPVRPVPRLDLLVRLREGAPGAPVLPLVPRRDVRGDVRGVPRRPPRRPGDAPRVRPPLARGLLRVRPVPRPAPARRVVHSPRRASRERVREMPLGTRRAKVREVRRWRRRRPPRRARANVPPRVFPVRPVRCRRGIVLRGARGRAVVRAVPRGRARAAVRVRVRPRRRGRNRPSARPEVPRGVFPMRRLPPTVPGRVVRRRLEVVVVVGGGVSARRRRPSTDLRPNRDRLGSRTTKRSPRRRLRVVLRDEPRRAVRGVRDAARGLSLRANQGVGRGDVHRVRDPPGVRLRRLRPVREDGLRGRSPSSSFGGFALRAEDARKTRREAAKRRRGGHRAVRRVREARGDDGRGRREALPPRRRRDGGSRRGRRCRDRDRRGRAKMREPLGFGVESVRRVPRRSFVPGFEDDARR